MRRTASIISIYAVRTYANLHEDTHYFRVRRTTFIVRKYTVRTHTQMNEDTCNVQ